jgi:hypothetical protein
VEDTVETIAQKPPANVPLCASMRDCLVRVPGWSQPRRAVVFRSGVIVTPTGAVLLDAVIVEEA